MSSERKNARSSSLSSGSRSSAASSSAGGMVGRKVASSGAGRSAGIVAALGGPAARDKINGFLRERGEEEVWDAGSLLNAASLIEKFLGTRAAPAGDDDPRFAWSDEAARLVAGGEVPRPEFLVADDPLWLMGHAHALIGESGDGKSFLLAALGAACGGVWAYLDEENGAVITADRLITMGADAAPLRHLPFAQPNLREAAELMALLEDAQPRLVGFDSGADFYRAAGIDENENTAVTAWQLAYPQPIARLLGACVITLDALPKDGSGTQRGASAKKYKADREIRLRKVAEFGREQVGEIELEVRKDRTGLLAVGYRQRYRIGGSPFVFQRADAAAQAGDQRDTPMAAMQRNVEQVLAREGAMSRETALSMNALMHLLSGNNGMKVEAARVLADDPRSAVRSGRGPRNAVLFWMATNDDSSSYPSHKAGNRGGEVVTSSPDPSRERSGEVGRGGDSSTDDLSQASAEPIGDDLSQRPPAGKSAGRGGAVPQVVAP